MKEATWDNGKSPNNDEVIATESKIQNVLRHHCDNHNYCTNPEWCSFLKTKIELGHTANKQLDNPEIQQGQNKISEAGKSQFEYDLQLNSKGLALCQQKVGMHFNTTTIANLSKCHTTNTIESMWSQVIKMGKHV